MEISQTWFSDKVTISKFPTVEDIEGGKFANCKFRINVSDLFRPEIDIAFQNNGVANYWFPLGEAFGMPLESLYGALRIMWEAEKQNQPLLLHCHAGNNRSVLIADCYYFLSTQEHREQNHPDLSYAKNKPNRLSLNIDDGQLPGIYKMEEFLQNCKEAFDESFTEPKRPLDWIKHELHMTGSGFAA